MAGAGVTETVGARWMCSTGSGMRGGRSPYGGCAVTSMAVSLSSGDKQIKLFLAVSWECENMRY